MHVDVCCFDLKLSSYFGHERNLEVGGGATRILKKRFVTRGRRVLLTNHHDELEHTSTIYN